MTSSSDDFNPAGLPDPAALNIGEQTRSRKTKLRILEAGTELLAEIGYKKLSTTLVAKRAGITRAAMLYHFGSRIEMVEAIANYVTRRRVEIYFEAMADIPHDADFSRRAIDTAWAQLQLPEFAAFTELSLASRTDEELASVFRPTMAAFDQARRRTAQELFPPELIDDNYFDLRRDLSRFLLEGMAQQDGITFDVETRRRNLIDLLKELVTSADGKAILRRVAERNQGGR